MQKRYFILLLIIFSTLTYVFFVEKNKIEPTITFKNIIVDSSITTSTASENDSKEKTKIEEELNTILQSTIQTPITETKRIPIEEQKVIQEDSYAIYENFSSTGLLEQAESFEASNSDRWWLNSGGFMISSNGVGSTIQGRLPSGSELVSRYAPKGERTDGGYRPQNIFRLLTQKVFVNSITELRFQNTGTDSTDSVERGESNGVLLFGHYIDSENLYYAGVRVDGQLVIKKKKEGTYYTLATKKVFPGTYGKNKLSKRNLIPYKRWIGLRVEFLNVTETSLLITLMIDTNDDGTYDHTITALDGGTTYGGSAITGMGHNGIRTDFMDLIFDDYYVQ